MDDKINCEHGVAYMSLSSNHQNILVCGSLVKASYWTLPSSILLDIKEYNLIPNEKDLKDNDITYYKHDCELKVDIISTNSICLRLYKKDYDDDEGNYIGFCISTRELFKISQIFLLR